MFDVPPILIYQGIVSGILLGLIYTAMAVGLSLTMGVMRVVNVAHSTFIILGAYVAFTLFRTFGLDPVIAGIFILPLFFLIGMGVDAIFMRRVATAESTTGLLILFGLLVVIESVAILIWTTDTQVITVDYGPSILVGDIILSRPRLVAGAISLVMVGALYFFLQRTIIGKGIRAMSQNRNAAMMMGINVDRLSLVVFGIGTMTAAAGGIALALIFPFTPQDHIRWLAWAFLVVIVGGLGNVRNTLFAGLGVGIVESLAGVLLPFQYVSLVIYSMLALALMVRGQGLAGIKRRTI